MRITLIPKKRLALVLALALACFVSALGESFPTGEAFPSGESFPTGETFPAGEAFAPEEALPSGQGDEYSPAEAADEGSAQTPAVPDFTVQPRGSDEAERVFAEALSNWAAGARAVRTTTGGTLLLDEKTPVYTLMSSAAYRTGESAYLSSPGSAAGLEQAASQLIGEMNANRQSLALDLSADKPFRGSFAPSSFTLRLVQAVYDAGGAVAMDCAILTLTDAAGNPQENPAYAMVRFFAADDAVCWLSADLQMMQLVAQMNQIRTSGATGLSLSPVLPAGEAPDWSSIVKTAANGTAYNPDAAGFTVGQAGNPAAVQSAPEAYNPNVGTFDTAGTFDAAGSFGAAAAVTPEPTPSVQYVTIKDGVSAASIRESPTTNSRRVAMAYPGVQYEFWGVTEYSWIMINTPDGQYGYISPKLVGPLPGEENGRRVTVTKSMTIHEEPTYYSNEPSSVRAGHSYYLINDQLEEWVQIRNTDGSIGYVNRKFIR